MKSQICNTFLIVLVAQSQVAFAEPMRVVDDVVPTITNPLGTLLGAVIGAVRDVTNLGGLLGGVTVGLLGDHGLVDGIHSVDRHELLGNHGFVDGLLDDDGLLRRELIEDESVLRRLVNGLLREDGLVGGLLGDDGLLGGVLVIVVDLVQTLLSAVLELLNNLLGGFDSEMNVITATASNTLNSSSGIWNETLATGPLVIEKAVKDTHQLAANVMGTLSRTILDALENKFILASVIIDALKMALNKIAEVLAIPDTIDKFLVSISTVTCSVFNSVLKVLLKIPNIPEGVTDLIENSCSVLHQTLFDFMRQIQNITNPSLEPLKIIAPMLLDNLKSIVNATGINLIEINPDISTIEIPLTSTINSLLSTLAINLNASNIVVQQAIQTLTNTANAGPDLVNNALNAVFSLIPNTNCSNTIEKSKASITEGGISNTTECMNIAITSLQGIVNQYTSIINDINTSISTGFLKVTSLDSYIRMVANSGVVILNTIFGIGSCLAHGCGLAITEFVKLIMDSIHCLASPA